MKKQLQIFKDEASYLKSCPDIYGVMLTGSVSYGTATEYSDLDIIVLCNKDEFESKYVDNILVETHFHKYETMLNNLISNILNTPDCNEYNRG